MVYFINGERFPGRNDGKTKDGEWVRTSPAFRDVISSEPGAKFPVERGRYHIYSSHACPWCHGASMVRMLKGLEDVVGISYVSPIRDDDVGWELVTNDEYNGCIEDTVGGLRYVYELYLQSDHSYTGTITVPVLYDTKTKRIVSNESSEIVRMFNNFGTLATKNIDLFPKELEAAVDSWCKDIYMPINNGVYRAVFAKSQEVYESVVKDMFIMLDKVENVLSTRRYLAGDRFTMADLRLFATLVRFDTVYYTLFKTNVRRIQDYPNLSHYTRSIYQIPGIADTVNFHHIREHYYTSFSSANPKQIIPRSGDPNLRAWHNRGKFETEASDTNHRAMGIAGSENGTGVNGEFVRKLSGHREVITADGSSGFVAEAGRYHLFVANNCPWCHRTMLARHILGLQDIISADILWYKRDAENGWQYNPAEPGCTEETLGLGVKYAKDIYALVGSQEKSLPILWDKKTGSIVNNESALIIRMFNDAFKKFSTTKLDLVPSEIEETIDRINAFTYTSINNGAYRAGFASTQAAYEIAHDNYFDALDTLDRILQFQPYLVGNVITEADVRLFPTIYRHDHVYYNRFLLKKKMIRDYVHLYAWLRRMLAIPGVKEASNMDHCKKGYFGRTANMLVPVGPNFDFEEPVPPVL